MTIAGSDAEAQAIEAARHAKLDLKKALAQLGRPFNYHDFTQYDLDGPFPDLGDLGANGYRSHAERIKRIAREEQLTVRQAAYRFTARHSPFVGSPETVANEIERWFREGAATASTSEWASRTSSRSSRARSCRCCKHAAYSAASTRVTPCAATWA